MAKSDSMTGFFFLFFSLVIAIESFRLGVGNLHAPQAGFLPFAASIILGILSCILLLSTRRKERQLGEEIEEPTFHRHRISKVFCVIVSLFLYAIFLNALGFLLASMILMAIMLRAIDPQKWYVVTLGTILIPITAYLLFDVFLEVQLPKGFLGF